MRAAAATTVAVEVPSRCRRTSQTQSTHRQHMKEHNNNNNNNKIHQQPRHINSNSKQGVQNISILQRAGAVRPAPNSDREKTEDRGQAKTYHLQTEKKEKSCAADGERTTFYPDATTRNTGEKQFEGEKKTSMIERARRDFRTAGATAVATNEMGQRT